MPLPPPQVSRTLQHTREVRFEGYRREDGLWDIEGRLVDFKPNDFHIPSGVIPAGVLIHDMRARLTIDEQFNILDACVASDAHPYRGFCDSTLADYRSLIGERLFPDFRRVVRERFGEIHGCAHINELLVRFPSAAIQSFAGWGRVIEELDTKPFELDRCCALDTRGEGVRLFYPKWHQPVKEGEKMSTESAT